MPITKEDKNRILDSYLKALKNAEGMVITEYRGMAMKNINAIRGAVRGAKGRYIVTKNTLFKIALKETGFACPEDLFAGPTAVAVAYADLPALTKAVLGRAKEDELLILKGAIMGETVFKKAQLDALSTLPTLSEARAMLLGLLETPASQLVGVLQAPAQELAMVLKAYSDKEGEAA